MCDPAFTADEIAQCEAAMRKPAPLRALALIASGRVVIEISPDGRNVLLDEYDGQRFRDPEHPDRKMGLAGAWPLFGAGMIDRFGVVTPAGLATLAAAAEEQPGG